MSSNKLRRRIQHEKAPKLLEKLSASSRKELMTFEGGLDKGDPCEALAHHGFNGLENEVVARIVSWMTGK